MCTIIVLNDAVEGFPLIIVANRDESYKRPSTVPTVHNYPPNEMIAPVDIRGDGTWMGVTENAWVVTVTNQEESIADERPRELSRGSVVWNALEAGNHLMTARMLRFLEAEKYGAFNLVFGRPGAMFRSTIMLGHPLEMVPLFDKVNVVCNDCVNGTYKAKEDRTKYLVNELLGTSASPHEIFQGLLVTVMASHGEASSSFEPLCMHDTLNDWGTVSTSMVTVSNQGLVEYWYSEGPACESSCFFRAGSIPAKLHD